MDSRQSQEIFIRSDAVEGGRITGPLLAWLVQRYPEHIQGTLRGDNMECHDLNIIYKAIDEIRVIVAPKVLRA